MDAWIGLPPERFPRPRGDRPEYLRRKSRRHSPAHAPNIRGSPAHAGIDPNITAQIQTAPGFPPSRPRPGARPAPSATGSTKSRPGRELPRKGSRPPVKPASSDDNPAHGPRSLVPARNRGRSGRSLRRRTQGGDPEEGECLEMPGYRRCERQPRGLAGKPLAGFRATPSRRIPVLYGPVVLFSVNYFCRLASIILAGSPPVSDHAAGPLRCGSWARRIQG